MAIILILIVGFCVFVTAFVSDIEESLRQLNSDVIAAHEMKNLTKREQLKMKEKLFDIIAFHSESIRLTKRFSRTNQKLIMAYFLYATMCACSLFLQIHMVIDDKAFFCIAIVSFWCFF